MANKTVTLMRYCKTSDDSWQRLPTVIGGNGRVRPDYVVENGLEVKYPEGRYILRFYVGSKVKYKSVGTNVAHALAECKRQELGLQTRDVASRAGIVLPQESTRKTLRTALDEFVVESEGRGASVASEAYRLAGDEFLLHVSKTYADEILRSDFALHERKLRARGLSDRTVANRHTLVVSFARFAGVSEDALPLRKPRFEKTLPEAYSDAELKAFFAALTSDYHRIVFTRALKCGLREQELMYLQWMDIDWSRKTLLERSKPDWGFNIKDKEQRLLSIPADLLALLRAYSEANPDALFVTGTSGNKTNKKLLRTLKRIVQGAGLNCGTCESCRQHNECERWFLHKFRSTFATTLLRIAWDVRTVQKATGHSDIESTMRYLRPQEDEAMQGMMNAIACPA